MEFYFQLTVWECIICGIRRTSGRLFHILSEVIGVYERCGKYPRKVRIEDGLIFVIDKSDTREYPCRGIQEFRKKGRIYWVVMTGRIGNPVQLFLPVRVVGDKQAQEVFWKYLNDQRRISGDKLVMSMAGRGEEAKCAQTGLPGYIPGGGWQIFQRWDLDKLSMAVAQSLWIQHHCMAKRRWKDWGLDNLPIFLASAALAPVSWYLLNTQTIPLFLAFYAVLGFRTLQDGKRWEHIPIKDIRSQVKSWGSGIYEEVWKLSLSPEQITRKIPQLENVWKWESVGYLTETEELYFFFTRQQRLMFYVEKELFGDWMAQKLFVQDCQNRGVRCQVAQPKISMDMGLAEAGQADNIRLITDKSPDKRKQRRKDANTQEDWRKFWAKKEKERGNTDKKTMMIAILGLGAILALAFLLPEYGGRQDIAGMPVMMDMPAEGEPYVFHPDDYQDYVPLARQAEVLASLGFEIPKEAVDSLNADMGKMPMSRVWIEGYPYRSLLSLIGMPERNYETWEMEQYPEQAYWFDWEGFDMSSEYANILNGVNAMAKGEFAISDISQEMSEVDWEKGSGVVHVSFCVNGNPYKYQLKLEYDWLDSNIIGDINDALKNSGIEKRVYAMEDGGQGCILFYRDKEWAARFRKETGIKLLYSDSGDRINNGI